MKEITIESYFVIGLMSGTSLDGIDLAYLKFEHNNNWKFTIISATTIPYPSFWKNRLQHAHLLDEKALLALDIDYTAYLSETLLNFIDSASIEKIDAVCSHGHTVLHNPKVGITYQIGNRSEFAKKIGLRVVCDFRSQDVALGGQGAPLVPVGDQLLFGQYDACLNLGGFANCSVGSDQHLIAFDLCPVNTVLNRLVNKIGLAYDDEGTLARQGKLIPILYEQLNGLEYYQKSPPKSLGIEWVSDFIFPLLQGYDQSPLNDLLFTFTEHVAYQIGSYFSAGQEVLVSGGGGFNTYLMERIQKISAAKFHLPEKNIIDYKEALIFGLLGVLRLRNEFNCWASVTGAERNHSSGSIFYP